jgi:hypothetical protein
LFGITCFVGISLFGNYNSAVKLGDKAFDLVVPPREILDLSTYDKTVQELRLTNTILIQKLRESTPVENELRNFGLYHPQLMKFGKSSGAELNNSQQQSLKKSDSVPVNNNNNLTSHVDENAMDASSDSYESQSDDEEPDRESDFDEDDDDMQVSDDDMDVSN